MRDKIMTYIFIIYIIGFMLLSIVVKDKDISYSERRELSKIPELNTKTIFNGEYDEKLEKYFLDQFPFRDNFRSIKANTNYRIFRKLENNNIYIKDNYIYKSNYPTNKKSIDYFIKHINTTKNLLNKDNNAYLVIIPDKNYYLHTNDFLQINYDYLYDKIDSININKIDIKNNLNINDYYETDTHWKQERLDKVVNTILKKMNIEPMKINYQKQTYDKFYGSYYSEAAIKRKPEVITYLTNSNLDNIKVKYLENKELKIIYNKDKLNKFNSYDVYLDGSSSFIEIINEKAHTNKELVIFRDSFGSSIAPLLVEYYKKITIIDNRYISSENYLSLIEFTNQDVLFLYSTLIVNNSLTIKN